MSTIQSLFPVPFAFDQYPAAARLNPALRTLFLAREGDADRNRDPYTERNDALFESRFELARRFRRGCYNTSRRSWVRASASLSRSTARSRPDRSSRYWVVLPGS